MHQRCCWQQCPRGGGDQARARGEEDGPPIQSSVTVSSRDDEKGDFELGLKEGPSLGRGEWGRSGRSSAGARIQAGSPGRCPQVLVEQPEASE